MQADVVTTVDEVVIRNHTVVTVQGQIKTYPNARLGLIFESAGDAEVLQAVSNVLREELGLSLPEGSFVVSRSAENQNFSVHPKTVLG